MKELLSLNESPACERAGRVLTPPSPLEAAQGLWGRPLASLVALGFEWLFLRNQRLFSGFPLIKEAFPLQGCHC